MFNLDAEIQSWRKGAAGALGDHAAILDELESHLLDEMDHLVQGGKAPQQALKIAMKRLGNPESLAEEFDKVPGRIWAPAWLAMGGLAALAVFLAWAMISQVVSGRAQPLLAVHVFAITTGYAAVFAVGFLSVWVIVARALGKWDTRRTAVLRSNAFALSALGVTATAVGLVLGAWWAREHLGRYWAWDPREIGALSVLGWGIVLLRSFRPGKAELQPLLLLAAMGNMVVALSWFGPSLLGTHSYGVSPVGWLLGGFIVTQMIVIYVAMGKSVSATVRPSP